MSVHINAKPGEISEKILLPGDPLRAKWMAEHFLEDVVCYNTTRNMLGFTGTYKKTRISIQGTGMGMPSASIYINELINEFGVKQLIRLGSAGSLQEEVDLRNLVIAMSASHNSGMYKHIFNDDYFAPTADFSMFQKAIDIANATSVRYHAGNVLSSDTFYFDDKSYYELWSKFNTLCVEMETAALYTLAAKYNVKALSILTISDSVVNGKSLDADLREHSFKDMVNLALEVFTS